MPASRPSPRAWSLNGVDDAFDRVVLALPKAEGLYGEEAVRHRPTSGFKAPVRSTTAMAQARSAARSAAPAVTAPSAASGGIGIGVGGGY